MPAAREMTVAAGAPIRGRRARRSEPLRRGAALLTLVILGVGLAGLPPAWTARAQGGGITPEYLQSTEKIRLGRQVWVARCQFCHGKMAYPGKAPRLDPSRYTPDFVYDRVTNGFRDMPPWRQEFSEDELKAVVAYVLSKQFPN